VLTPAESPSASEALIERRFYPRVAPAGLVSISFGDSNPGMLLNLSENGMLVSTPVALVQNFVCRVSLLLDGLAHPIEVYTRVVWTSESHRSGIQLLDLCDHDREQLRKWAALETDHPSAAVPQQQPQTKMPRQVSTREKSAPQKVGRSASSAHIQLIAGAAAAVLMLTVALILRGTPLRGLFGHSFRPAPSVSMAMQPGGAVADQAPDAQAFVPPSTPANGQESPTVVAAMPAAPMSTSAPIPAHNDAAPQSKNPFTAENKNLPAATAHKFPAPAVSTRGIATSTVAAKPTKLPARNHSVVDAKKHFGDQFIGHLDLASSGDENTSASQTLSHSTGTDKLTAPIEEKRADTSPAPPPPAAPPESRISAIAGSITADSAADAQRRKDTPTEASTAPSTASAPTSFAQPATAAANPSDRSLQITLPTATHALYVNLPGEQVIQSSGTTLHIQRAVLAPSTSTASASPRTETVVIGDLLAHADPRAPHLSPETGNRVGLRAFLSSDGRVEKLMPVNGSVALVSSAARAIREWRFQPTLLAGQPVPMAIYVLVEFHAEESEHP